MANGMSNQTIKPDEYEEIREFLEKACGIVLGDNKEYLVASRLDDLLEEFSLGSVKELINTLKNNPGTGLRQRIIDAMTTHETSWFRDGYPYEILKKVILPEIANRNAGEVRIWSAACSSGQEPYSISMIIQEFLREHPGSLSFAQIVSTEISTSMLQKAREGLYDRMSLSRGLSQERKDRFFSPDGDHWQIKREIRDRVVFKQLNLMDSFMLLGKFDVVFCRNVLIYFSDAAKEDILRRITQTLRPGGYIFMGGSESLSRVADEFEILRLCDGIVYRLKDHPAKK